jgi:hypothetical protein
MAEKRLMTESRTDPSYSIILYGAGLEREKESKNVYFVNVIATDRN